MKPNVVLKNQHFNGGLAGLAKVLEIEEYKKQRIDMTLNSIVFVKGRTNVILKELFSPFCKSAVVIRRHDGSYIDPCDFSLNL